jgi:hypothetical protein
VKKCSYCGNESGDNSTHCIRCGTDFDSSPSLPGSGAPLPCCPQCGSQQYQQAGLLRRSINPWVAHFGGWIISTLFSASRKQQMLCTQCETFFFVETKSSRIAFVLLLLVLLLSSLCIILDLLQ